LDRQGEFLGLYHIFEQRYSDSLSRSLPLQFRDVAYGRYGREAEPSYGYLANPTPGRANDERLVWSEAVAPVDFSVSRGFFAEPFGLALSTTTPAATIRYTLDGREPDQTGGLLYTGPLTIETTTVVRAVALKPGSLPGPVTTQSYLFPEAVLAQPEYPPGFPKSWGGYAGVPVKADYEMDPAVVQGATAALKAALASLPTLSLVTEPGHFYDLYSNPRRRGRAWERPVSVEFFDPAGAEAGFHLDAGIRIQGELGRRESMPKHAFRLFFRGEYGSPWLDYPLFPDSPVASFDTLVLRGGVNRSFAGYPKRPAELKATTYTRDEWLRASQLAMSGAGARGRFVHLYLNGLYWGLYNLVERPDEAFMAAHFGGTAADWQAINHAETTGHSSARFAALHQLAQQGGLANPETYATMQSYLDIPHFIDYLILNWYTGNLDWGFNNWYAGVGQEQGPVKYFVWDGERTWYDGAEIYMEFAEYNGQPNLVKPLFSALLENPDFRMLLADRMVKHLFNEGALSQEKSQARWLALSRTVEPAILAESARWGDTRFDPPLGQADWRLARDDVLAQMVGNGAKLIELARQAGYYPALDPPVLSQPGGRVRAGTLVQLVPGAGATVTYYTTDGSDPRLAGSGALNPQAQPYREPLRLSGPIQLKARRFDGQNWSALQEAFFEIEAAE
jgi:hypothetical protein